jgi:XTP/dITP diphosphohydrolase
MWQRKQDMKPSLLIATSNPGKLKEMQALLIGLDVTLVLPSDLGIQMDVVEDGMTYAENAGLKARAFCAASHLITLADDSGLEVDVLNGQPGLHSARYSPISGATDADRRHYLLHNLAGKPHPWTARFHCTVAVAAPGGNIQFAEGICPGEIIENERGDNGFGYDPLFLLPGLGRTMAELSMDEKNELSHRARAVHAALPLIKALL